jgi:hypothetical protein
LGDNRICGRHCDNRRAGIDILYLQETDAQMSEYLDKWEKFLANDPGYDILTSSPMIQELINKIVPMGQSFIEWGYGTGYTAIALANQKRQVKAYDPASGLLARAIEAKTKHLVSFSGKVEFTDKVADLQPADIVYSQGLLEHFDNERLYEIISAQLSFAKIAVVFSIPSINYPQTDFGDERLLDIAGWETVLTPFKDRLTQLYYYERNQHLIGVIRK